MNHLSLRRLAYQCGIVLLATLIGVGAAAAQYPDRPIKLVVPFAPGGGTDLIARAVGAEMGKELGQVVVIENKPGAGTLIGTDNVAKSAADGYTVLIASFAHAVNPSLQAKLPYDHSTAFAPITLIGTGPNVLVVGAKSPYTTVESLIQGATKSAVGLTYASQGIGTSAHLAGALFASATKAPLTHVPYRGAGPAINDLIGGQVDMMFATASAVSSHVKSGKLRALAVTSQQPSPAFPGTESLQKTVPGYVVESWYGLYVPAGTPDDTKSRLNAAARLAVGSENVRRQVEQEGLMLKGGTPAELDEYVKAEEARWRKIVEENQLQAH